MAIRSRHDVARVKRVLWVVPVLTLAFPACLAAQQPDRADPASHVLSPSQVDALLTRRPACLEGFRTNQTGMLSRIDAPPGVRAESTFTVETLSVPSDGVLIRGWLYLPRQSANGRHPAIVLTNGGGDGSRPIKSLSDWIAPILAHCGIAALVHDKRGTGESGGRFVETTYDDYATDAGNLAVYLTRHPRINPRLIGVLGGSEGGRVAVLAASRFAAVTFAISFAGTVVSAQDDRIYAQMGGLRARGIADSVIAAVEPLWRRSFAAWASDKAADHARVDAEIAEARRSYPRDVLPFTKEEMERIPDFAVVLPTWRSLGRDYMTEMERFGKPWLAMFGALDTVVPTQASVRNIQRLMTLSRNTRYTIAVIPRCGHAPVDVETRRMIRMDHLILNWLADHVLRD
jgi:pimeloyl-ACP methyl ester carboxylesterase